MESIEKNNTDYMTVKQLGKKMNNKKNFGKGMIAKHLQSTFKRHSGLQSGVTRSECGTGSCPNLHMSRPEQQEQRRVVMTLSPQLHPRAPLPLCLSLSSESSICLKALDTQEWKNNLKAQMEWAHSAGAASSTGSLERASSFWASGSTTASSSGLSSPVEPLSLSKGKSPGPFSHFSPPWNSSSESDSNPPSRSSSKKWRHQGQKGGVGSRGDDITEPKQEAVEPFQHSEPIISRVTDFIYVGNLSAACSGRTLCRSDINSVVDMSCLQGENGPQLVPCTCTRRAGHIWSRLKVDLQDQNPTLENLSFEDVNECIAASTEKRRRVLVFCRDGYSLAPTCIIQYLMVRCNMRLMAAYELLRSRHPVNIMASHQHLLVQLERSLQPTATVDPQGFKQAISRRVAWN